MKRVSVAGAWFAVLLLSSCGNQRFESVAVVPETRRVSVGMDGSPANGPSTGPLHVSDDARFVAFTSSATNLVADDLNGVDDVFVRDTQLGRTVRSSVSSDGDEADGVSDRPALSSDGRVIVFRSSATQLVVMDTNGHADIFLHDMETGSTERISVDSSGVEADGPSHWASVSEDGRTVVFSSDATNLVAGDTNGRRDIFLRDRLLGVTIRVSTVDGGEPDGDSDNPVISADGSTVAYRSAATNLVVGDTNGVDDVFVYDLEQEATFRVSVSSEGQQADAASAVPSLSRNGRLVSFESGATQLVPADANGLTDVFVHDRLEGSTRRASLTLVEPDGASGGGVLEPGGRYLAFASTATQLVTGDDNGLRDVFVLDLLTGTIDLASRTSTFLQADGDSNAPLVSSDGARIVFLSAATNLVEGDTNGVQDVFLRVLMP